MNFLSAPFLFVANLLRLTKWISVQPTSGILNDFYTASRDLNKRYILYQYVVTKERLESDPIDYFEFGVNEGSSFKWWLAANKNPGSNFYGFDTFEGLPEKWGHYAKGDMAAGIPQIDDSRHKFIKGLFQDTLFSFLQSHRMSHGRRKVVHLDADLFSSTLFALTSLAPYFNEGDIIIFDEFNVPNHEYFAFKCFTDSFPFKLQLIAAQNNYYEVAFRVM